MKMQAVFFSKNISMDHIIQQKNVKQSNKVYLVSITRDDDQTKKYILKYLEK